MANKKYQIFVSSTFRDLSEERQDAIRNILDLKHIPAGMELFPAADIEQLEYIKRVIDECDYYLLIIGGRYGSVDSDGVSFTEREYEYAVDTGKIVIAFVHSDPASIPVGKSETSPEVIDALNNFRDRVITGRLVRMWNTRQDLEPIILKSLIHAFNDFPQQGWIRGNAAASDDVLAQANNALQENAELKKRIELLEAERAPKFENLSDFDDPVTIRYESSYYSSRQRERFYTSRDLPTTWRELFVSVASCLEKSKTDQVILSGAKLLASEKELTEPYRINTSDKVMAKAQFLALGLISTKVSRTTQGGVEEFLSLTKKGSQVFLENVVSRKS